MSSLTSSIPLPSTSRLCTCSPSLERLKVTVPAPVVGSDGSSLYSVSEIAISPPPDDSTVVDVSVELVSLAALVVSLSSSPQAAKTSGMTIAKRARSFRGTDNLLGELAFHPSIRVSPSPGLETGANPARPAARTT